MLRSLERLPKHLTTLPDLDLVAEWDRRLKESDRALMTQDEEGQGVQFGAEGAEEVEFVDTSESDQRITAIAQAIASEPGNELWHVPADLAALRQAILAQVRECRKKSYGEPKVGIHTSCVTGDPCVFIQLPEKHPRAGIVLHLPTVDIDQFFPDEFAAQISESANIEMRFKP